MFKIQDGIGEKLGLFYVYLSTCLSCIVCAFYFGWKLSLVTFAGVPVLGIATGFLAKMQSTLAGREMRVYSAAGGLAEEAIRSIRTVKAFNAQRRELGRFESLLRPALRAAIWRGFFTGIGSGLVWVANYSFFSLAFWYGIQLILDSCSTGQHYDAGLVTIVLFNALGAAYKFGQMLPLLEMFSLARGAAAGIFRIVDRAPLIDSSAETVGKRLDVIKGNINFKKVRFSYPSRPDAPVLKEITFRIKAGQTIALVGESGCGKSTCVQLLQRFYDPSRGRIQIDGVDLKDFNIHWWRDQIGVVSQEPVLFSASIADNIRLGHPSATKEDVERAARQANAHDFIRLLPLGYETQVGERGAQLSGGQKQRIAIARALVRNPKILLFDEATSALDVQSEAAVQRALNEARQGRTTIIVAHRLSTIQNADRIVVLHQGTIAVTLIFLLKRFSQ